jgi:hypothetical protein
MFRSALAAIIAAATPLAAPLVTTPEAKPDNDIAVVAEAVLASPAAAAVPVTAGAACADTAFALSSWRATSTFKWYYNPAAAPASVAPTALAAVRTGTTNAFTGQNRCGTAPALSTTEQYLGTSTKTAGVSAKGACTGNDGVSVTSWGALPTTTLAYTCTYYRPSTGAVLASDMLIDNALHQWFTTKPASCTNKFDLMSVIVHERGHTLGLDHVAQAQHATATMSPTTGPCDVAKRLLAAGDLAGMKSLYAK